MPKLRVAAFSLSLDGYGAGTDQGLNNPLGTHGPHNDIQKAAVRNFEVALVKVPWYRTLEYI